MRIKEIIREKGTTLQEVAIKMGVKPPSLSRAINGNTTVEMLERIAAALECEVADFFIDRSPVASLACPHCGGSIRLEKAD